MTASRRPLLRLPALGFLLVLASAVAAGPRWLQPAYPWGDRDELVRQLGDDNFGTRERAYRRLDEIGEAALPALRRGRTSEDAEVRRSVAALITTIEGRLYAQLHCLTGHDKGIWT